MNEVSPNKDYKYFIIDAYMDDNRYMEPTIITKPPVVEGDLERSTTTVNTMLVDKNESFRQRDYLQTKIDKLFKSDKRSGNLEFNSRTISKPINNIKLIVIGNSAISDCKYFIEYFGKKEKITPLSLISSNSGPFIHYITESESNSTSEFAKNIVLRVPIYQVKLRIEHSYHGMPLYISEIRLIIGV